MDDPSSAAPQADASSPRFLNVSSIPNISIVSNDIFALPTVHPCSPLCIFSAYFTTIPRRTTRFLDSNGTFAQGVQASVWGAGAPHTGPG